MTTAYQDADYRRYIAPACMPRRRRWRTPGALARALEPRTRTSRALALIDRELAALADHKSGADALAIAMPPQEGKPVYAGAMILMGDGSRKRLRDIKAGDTVISHRGVPCVVEAVHEQGDLPIVKITTHAGRVIRAAASHPFLTPDGWVEAGKLTPGNGGGQGTVRVDGDVLAVVRAPRPESDTALTAEAARLLGYFIGDGNTTVSTPGPRGGSFNAAIKCDDDTEGADIEACAAALGFGITGRPAPPVAEGRWPRAAALSLSGGVRPWLRLHGLAGRTSYTKRVPAAIFTSHPEIAAEFIGAYFACDGTVSRRGGARPDCRLEFNSVSRDLLADVQHLLVRLGIASTLRPKYTTYDGKPYTSWRLLMRRQDDAARFRQIVPVHHRKAIVLGAWDLHRTEFDTAYIADPVVAVEREDPAECRCLTVAEDHTFTVEDVVVHNSERVSRRFPAWLLAHNPALRIGIVSYELEMAVRWGRQIKRDLAAADPRILNVTITEDSKAAGRWDTPQGGGVYCVGIGGALTGRPLDVLLIDDPVKGREEAESETYRRRAWDWWENVAISRLATGGIVCLIMTRWHEDDLAGQILAKPGPLQWRILTLPAIAGENDPLRRDPGDEFPSVRDRPPGYFYRLQATLSPYVWASIYQQTPTAAAGNFFRRVSFRYWRTVTGQPHPATLLASYRYAGVYIDLDGQQTDLADDAVWRFATIDVAASEKTSADWTVVAVWAISRQGDLILLDRARGHAEMSDHFAMVKPLRDRWHFDICYVEHQFYSKTLVTDAREAGIPVAEVTADKDKITRAIPAAGRLHAGKVWWPADAPWLAEWENEIASFPRAAHDDQVDVFAYAARIAAAHWTPAPPPPRPPKLPRDLTEIENAYGAATGNGNQDVMTMPLG